MELKQSYTMQDLLDIVKLLRDPKDGCAWDKAQTHKSIRTNFIEETYEAVEAIDLGDTELLKEELGDVLLQVALHTQMESETGNFNFDDVTSEICKKLILRHPHIFGDVKADTAGKVLQNWEEIKRKEKNRTTPQDDMASVPTSLPALMRSTKVQKKAAAYGFCYEDINGALKDFDSEVQELKTALENCDADNISEELGDILFACVNVCRFAKVDAEQALLISTQKFVNRFNCTQELAQKQQKQTSDMSFDELLELWRQAKVFTRSQDDFDKT